MSFIDNLVAHWKFDEASGNAVDSSGNGNTLVNYNSTPFVAGKVNNAADFEATSSNYFSIADASQTGLDLTGDCSFIFWVKMESQPTGALPYFMFINKWDEYNNQRSYAMYYQVVGGIASLALGVTNDRMVNDSRDMYYCPCTLVNGSWYHIAITWDASEAKAYFYVNGQLVGTAHTTGGHTSIYSGSAEFQVGTFIDGNLPDGVEYLDGVLDEMMIWSRVLTSHEIRNYYNSVIFQDGLPMPTFFIE